MPGTFCTRKRERKLKPENPLQRMGLQGTIMNLPRRGVLFLIRVYQATKPLRPNLCRYEPSCSEYAAQCVQKYGVVRGFALGIRRVLRCNPFSPGGYDPAP